MAVATISASSLILAGSSPTSVSRKSRWNRYFNVARSNIEQISSPKKKLAVKDTATLSDNDGRLSETKTNINKKNRSWNGELELLPNIYSNLDEVKEEKGKTLKDYIEDSLDLMMTIRSDGGPPRWFTPLDCGEFEFQSITDSPLLLFLPGMDGTGFGLIKHHHKLGKIFEIWCLHIPVKDRTSFTDLVKLVERTVRSEYKRSPDRPIYLVGESFGACIALDVAARNPDVDLVLILANPATSFHRSQLQSLIPLLELMPDQLLLNPPYMLNLVSGDPLRIAWENVLKGLQPLRTVREVLADTVTRETLLWKLQMLKSASASANSHLHAVKAQVLLLCSEKDQFFPSQEEAQRLRGMLPKWEIRMFEESGHFLFFDDNFDLVTSIKGASFYRHGKYIDYVLDYKPPTPYEFKKLYESHRWIVDITSPVMLSTLEDGKVVRGLSGLPSEGPVLYVGYHMLLGFELSPMVSQILMERNILLRGIAHPMMFIKLKDGKMRLDSYDKYRLMGAVPVSGPNFYKLLSSKAHVLLYPGGVREALHRKGEEYKLFWPEQSEFVRMASKFGAKIVPFGVVGEDDICELVLDYNDQMQIPPLRTFIRELTEEVVQLRTDANGEVSNQDFHLPGFLPKLPGRFYYYFGKPIETEGRKEELRNREKSHELYIHVKSEVERCIAYLKEKREEDPYRNILPRLLYQATHGFTAEIPTFEL